MIYVTGDTHGSIDFGKLETFALSHSALTKEDYVIIAGDFGGIWFPQEVDKDLERYMKLPFSVLFVDGNHENFDMLNAYPITLWKGGKVHMVRPDIIHLMRGQVFTMEGKTFFTFGGGTSIDKARRLEGHSWWPQEMPTFKEVDEGIKNLKVINNKVDYIITHSCDERALYYPLLRTNYKSMTVYPDNRLLSLFEETVDYKHWYFGHYHEDGAITDRKTALYHNILLLP